MTRNQLLKFIQIRNASGFSSNLQFEFDASEAGFDVKELGPVAKVGLKDAPAYHWETPFGTLIEFGGRLSLREAVPGALSPETSTIEYDV